VEIAIDFDCSKVNWRAVSETLKKVGMAHYAPDVHKKAFENSHTAVFVYHDGQLIGFGRAISDGAYQASVYDVAIIPEFQGQGVGKLIVKTIVGRLPQCNLILYASPGKESFYRQLGWRKMETGMALFKNAEEMAQRGFTE
jgi:ribosomal protein S18 acetylase RimI-like enzyme